MKHKNSSLSKTQVTETKHTAKIDLKEKYLSWLARVYPVKEDEDTNKQLNIQNPEADDAVFEKETTEERDTRRETWWLGNAFRDVPPPPIWRR